MATSRGLAAIIFADVAGYSRLSGIDEEGTHKRVMACLDKARATIEAKGGRVLRLTGDGLLASNASVVRAVEAALAIQTEQTDANRTLSDEQRIELRIGVHLGDVIEDRGEVYGAGVNVAARLEPLAPAGGICLSERASLELDETIRTQFGQAGTHRLKNIAEPMTLMVWPNDKAPAIRRKARKSPSKLVAAATLAALATVGAGYFYMQGMEEEFHLPSGPRIAVIPFENAARTTEGDFLSTGLTRDLNSQLSSFSNLFVLAPGATERYRGNLDCNAVRDDLSADYILNGSVSLTETKIRVTTSLIDAKTCRQLNSPGPFNRDLTISDILDIQLEISGKIAAQIGSADAPLFNSDVQREIRRKAPDDFQAYECVLMTYWFYETFEPDRHRRARACLEQSILPDSDYSLGWSRLAATYFESKKYAIDTPDDWAERSLEAANRALEIDRDNADAYYVLAIRSQMMREDPEVFREHAHQAIKLNPLDAFVLADLGTWMGYTGAWEEGLSWIERAKALNPNHQSWWDWVQLLYHYNEQEYEKARDTGIKINLPDNYIIQAAMVAIYGKLGDQQQARKALDHLLEIRPDFPEDPRAPYAIRRIDPVLIEELMDGLRKAGMAVP